MERSWNVMINFVEPTPPAVSHRAVRVASGPQAGGGGGPPPLGICFVSKLSLVPAQTYSSVEGTQYLFPGSVG